MVTNKHGDEVGNRTVDISGDEGVQLTEKFSGSDISSSTKPFDVTVTVTDTAGQTAQDSGSSK